MRKWAKLILCVILAVAVITATELALDIFEMSEYALGITEPERCELIAVDGTVREVEADAALCPWDWQAGESFRAVWHLPELHELPALYDDGYLYLTPGCSEMVFYIEGDEVFRVANRADASAFASTQATIPILPEWAGA